MLPHHRAILNIMLMVQRTLFGRVQQAFELGSVGRVHQLHIELMTVSFVPIRGQCNYQKVRLNFRKLNLG